MGHRLCGELTGGVKGRGTFIGKSVERVFHDFYFPRFSLVVEDDVENEE